MNSDWWKRVEEAYHRARDLSGNLYDHFEFDVQILICL